MRSLFIRVYETVLFFLVLVIFIGGLGASLFLGDYTPAFFAVLALIFYIERYQKIEKEALDIIKRKEKREQELKEWEERRASYLKEVAGDRELREREIIEKENAKKAEECRIKKEEERRAAGIAKERKRIDNVKKRRINKAVYKNLGRIKAEYELKSYIDDYGNINTARFTEWFYDYCDYLLDCNPFINSFGSLLRVYLSEQDKKEITERMLEYLKENATLNKIKITNPYDFEEQCAEILKNNGWEAEATRKSGDQGVDVVATKNGKRVVLQCKLYSHPVGNKAVQEVFTGKTFYNADFAVVVSNNEYTPQARELAENCGVLLLSVSDLTDLENNLV